MFIIENQVLTNYTNIKNKNIKDEKNNLIFLLVR